MNYFFMPIVTIMGLGYFPFFPGTVASFIGMIVWWFTPNIFFIQSESKCTQKIFYK